ncbi:MAG: hypothetical protein U1E76_24890 [Planctomycetota bacterium]
MKRQRSLVMVAAIVVVVVLGVLGSVRVAPTAQAARAAARADLPQLLPQHAADVHRGPGTGLGAVHDLLRHGVDHHWCCLLQGACEG